MNFSHDGALICWLHWPLHVSASGRLELHPSTDVPNTVRKKTTTPTTKMPALCSPKTKYSYTEKRNDMNRAMSKGSFSQRNGCKLFSREFMGGPVIALDLQDLLALWGAHERRRSHVVERWDRAALDFGFRRNQRVAVRPLRK